MKILVMNGPNLNLLGQREPGIYGSDSYESLCNRIAKTAKERGVAVDFYQSNHEGALIDRLQTAMSDCDGVILNAGAYTHTSVALRDAISSVKIPVVEVHISNVHAREEFRHHSMIAAVCAGQISGFGFMSYILAMDALIDIVSKKGG